MANRLFYTYSHPTGPDTNPSTYNDGTIPNKILGSYYDSIVFDKKRRTIWHEGMPYGHSYWGSTYGEVFNDYDNNTAYGKYSHAEGYNTYAEGAYSHTEGTYTKAIGIGSHAEGIHTYAAFTAAHSEGYYTYAAAYSHSEGAHSYTYAQYSHIEGANNYIYTGASYSHAEGYNNTIQIGAYAGHVEGSTNIVRKEYAHAEGYNTIAEGIGSHTEGNSTRATGTYSHAEGSESRTSSNYSHAEGGNTQTTGTYAHAEGYNTKAAGESSHTEGKDTYSGGTGSHAEGYGTYALGNYSHTEGNNTYAYDESSHAGGHNVKVRGTASFGHGSGIDMKAEYSHGVAIGQYVNITKNNEIAFGKYNESGTYTIFSIGYGTSTTDRKNIFEVKSDGISYSNGTSLVNTIAQDPTNTHIWKGTYADFQSVFRNNYPVDTLFFIEDDDIENEGFVPKSEYNQLVEKVDTLTHLLGKVIYRSEIGDIITPLTYLWSGSKDEYDNIDFKNNNYNDTSFIIRRPDQEYLNSKRPTEPTTYTIKWEIDKESVKYFKLSLDNGLYNVYDENASITAKAGTLYNWVGVPEDDYKQITGNGILNGNTTIEVKADSSYIYTLSWKFNPEHIEMMYVLNTYTQNMQMFDSNHSEGSFDCPGSNRSTYNISFSVKDGYQISNYKLNDREYEFTDNLISVVLHDGNYHLEVISEKIPEYKISVNPYTNIDNRFTTRIYCDLDGQKFEFDNSGELNFKLGQKLTWNTDYNTTYLVPQPGTLPNNRLEKPKGEIILKNPFEEKQPSGYTLYVLEPLFATPKTQIKIEMNDGIDHIDMEQTNFVGNVMLWDGLSGAEENKTGITRIIKDFNDTVEIGPEVTIIYDDGGDNHNGFITVGSSWKLTAYVRDGFRFGDSNTQTKTLENLDLGAENNFIKFTADPIPTRFITIIPNTYANMKITVSIDGAQSTTYETRTELEVREGSTISWNTEYDTDHFEFVQNGPTSELNSDLTVGENNFDIAPSVIVQSRQITFVTDGHVASISGKIDQDRLLYKLYDDIYDDISVEFDESNNEQTVTSYYGAYFNFTAEPKEGYEIKNISQKEFMLDENTEVTVETQPIYTVTVNVRMSPSVESSIIINGIEERLVENSISVTQFTITVNDIIDDKIPFSIELKNTIYMIGQDNISSNTEGIILNGNNQDNQKYNGEIILPSDKSITDISLNIRPVVNKGEQAKSLTLSLINNLNNEISNYDDFGLWKYVGTGDPGDFITDRDENNWELLLGPDKTSTTISDNNNEKFAAEIIDNIKNLYIGIPGRFDIKNMSSSNAPWTIQIKLYVNRTGDNFNNYLSISYQKLENTQDDIQHYGAMTNSSFSGITPEHMTIQNAGKYKCKFVDIQNKDNIIIEIIKVN